MGRRMRVIIHRGAIAALMQPTGQIGQATARGAGRIRDRAKEGATFDTGLMANSIISELVEQKATSVTWRIGSDLNYAIWQELGTPPIFARRAPVLVFKIGNQWITTHSTKGVPAARFLTKAIEAVSVEDFR